MDVIGTEMAEPTSRSKEKQLLLSIFKGESFVVKGTKSFKTLVRAKCADLKPEILLDSGTVTLTSVNSEPEFNSQLAWSIPGNQLTYLRSNRSTIRVSCMIIDETSNRNKETEIGYVVLHVKDATTFHTADVEPSKAKTYSLLGTKDPWRSYQPKLQMILHLETIPIQTKRQKSVDDLLDPIPKRLEHDISEIIKNEPKYGDSSDFRWTVNDSAGYFLLGVAADKDDLYILNTTIISASCLHLLWNGRSPRGRANNYFWQIKYTSYDSEIATEPFLLSSDATDDSRRTFIGDRSTARIRANGATFYQYLSQTTLQFQVLRHELDFHGKLCNEEVMGICFASLGDLTDPGQRELKLCLEILSEWGTPKAVSANEKPEIRVTFTLETMAALFPGEGVNDGSGDMGTQHQDSITESNQKSSEVSPETNLEDGDGGDEHDGVPPDVEETLNRSSARRLLQFDKNRELLPELRESPDKKKSQGNPRISNGSTQFISDSDSDEDATKVESLSKICPPSGVYTVTIELSKFWLKSNKTISDIFVLSYSHPPIEINDPVQYYCEAIPQSPESGGSKQGFFVINGTLTKTITVNQFSESMLNQPLIVEFKKFAKGTDAKGFASSMIPLGRTFLEQKCNKTRVLQSDIEILKNSTNVKIGYLQFEIHLTYEGDGDQGDCGKKQETKTSAFFPPKHPDVLNTKFEEQVRVPLPAAISELKEWQRVQEEAFLKERNERTEAYLNILSQEANKRDVEREQALLTKLKELSKQEKQIAAKGLQMEQREDKLKQLESELKEKVRQLTIDQDTMQQNFKLSQRGMEANYKIEVEGLRRKLEESEEVVARLKTKVSQLEKKIEIKEADIESLTELKREQPDSRDKVKHLEIENDALKGRLREAWLKKEQYKKQAHGLFQRLNRIQEDRDIELKDQNENLRLQILASKERKELKKERKAVQGISETLKALKIKDEVRHEFESSPRVSSGAPRRNSSGNRASEISRLTEERNKLLATGAYTQFDVVIKELERKIVNTAQATQ